MELEERSQRIVDVAIELAEQGGFEAVRLRDVAQQANVALGTLYARFSSKEDILVAALEQETQKFETLLSDFPLTGESAQHRIRDFFGVTSRALFDRKGFARAVLRAVASGIPELAERVLGYQERITRMAVATMRGPEGPSLTDEPPTATEVRVASLLQQIWFAELVGWTGGSVSADAVMANMDDAIDVVFRGVGLG